MVFDLSPTSILVFITLTLFIKHCVDAVGKKTIEDSAWQSYTSLAAKSGNSEFGLLAKKRAELVEINKKRKAISAQDEYAKWTKLNRQHDKLSAEVDQLAEKAAGLKAKINRWVSLAITMLTVVPVWFARIWYRKAILFYLPVGAFPPYLEWILALPFGVTGGIQLTIWMFALNSVIKNIIEAGKFFYKEPVLQPTSPAAAKEETKPEAIPTK